VEPCRAVGQSFPEADNALRRLYTIRASPRRVTDTKRPFLLRLFNTSTRPARHDTETGVQARTESVHPSLWANPAHPSDLVLGCSIVYGVEQPKMHRVMVDCGCEVAQNLFPSWNLRTFIGQIARPGARMSHPRLSQPAGAHARLAPEANCRSVRRGAGSLLRSWNHVPGVVGLSPGSCSRSNGSNTPSPSETYRSFGKFE